MVLVHMYGTGKVSIRITELVPPPGRRFDIKEKQVLLNIDSQTPSVPLSAVFFNNK